MIGTGGDRGCSGAEVEERRAFHHERTTFIIVAFLFRESFKFASNTVCYSPLPQRVSREHLSLIRSSRSWALRASKSGLFGGVGLRDSPTLTVSADTMYRPRLSRCTNEVLGTLVEGERNQYGCERTS